MTIELKGPTKSSGPFLPINSASTFSSEPTVSMPVPEISMQKILERVALLELGARSMRDAYLDATRRDEIEEVKVYLMEIHDLPILSLEEQIKLAQANELGIVAQKILHKDPEEEFVVEKGQKAEADLLSILEGKSLKHFEVIKAGLAVHTRLQLAIEPAQETSDFEFQIAHQSLLKSFPKNSRGKVSTMLREYEQGFIAEQLINGFPGSSPPTAATDYLYQLVYHGQLAKEALTKGNLRLVVSIAKKYIGQGLPFMDLIQEGNESLMNAIKDYNWRYGYRLSSYATRSIRQGITRALNENKEVPGNFIDDLKTLDGIIVFLEHELGYPPSELEIVIQLMKQRYPEWHEAIRAVSSYVMKVSTNSEGLEPTFADLKSAVVEGDLQIPQVPNPLMFLRRYVFARRKIHLLFQQRDFLTILSLDEPADGLDSTPADFLVDSEQDTEASARIRLLRELVEKSLVVLTFREKAIVQIRFGLGPYKTDHTLEETADIYSRLFSSPISKQRIHLILSKALRKLRHPTRSRALKDYLT